jgi:hypothetical protein
MRSTIYAVIFSTLFWCAGTAQAANDLDGKAVWCEDWHYGYVFRQGLVISYTYHGYSIVDVSHGKYNLEGTRFVKWMGMEFKLDRQTLRLTSRSGIKGSKSTPCAVSSKEEISQKINTIIAEAKKKNKI